MQRPDRGRHLRTTSPLGSIPASVSAWHLAGSGASTWRVARRLSVPLGRNHALQTPPRWRGPAYRSAHTRRLRAHTPPPAPRSPPARASPPPLPPPTSDPAPTPPPPPPPGPAIH